VQLLYDYRQSSILLFKSIENQFIYPNPKGSKLILSMLSSVLRSPWGRGKRRTEAKLDAFKINEIICMIPDTHNFL